MELLLGSEDGELVRAVAELCVDCVEALGAMGEGFRKGVWQG